MAKKTCKGLTYAKYVSGGAGGAITYSGGAAKDDYLCKVDINETRDNQKEHADGHQIDAANSLTAVQVALELANNDADIKKDLLGHKTGSATGDGRGADQRREGAVLYPLRRADHGGRGADLAERQGRREQ